MKVTKGGLVQAWYRLEDVFFAWYEQIQQEGLSSAVLHGDETGWRVNGKTHWLWCFSNQRLTYYLIDRSGRAGVAEILRRGVQRHAYKRFLGRLQRDFRRPEAKMPGSSFPRLGTCGKIQKSRKTLGGIRQKVAALDGRRHPFVEARGAAPGGIRVAAGMSGQTIAGTDRNRLARSAIIRKNSYANRSQHGSDTQAVLMSIFRTLKQRGYDLLDSIIQALKICLTTGKLPPLPP